MCWGQHLMCIINPMHRIGAHLSIAGGHIKAIERTLAIGGNAVQIFCASPRGWNFVKIDDSTAEQFKKEANRQDVSPVYFHASYLINLADGSRIANLSKQLLIHELKIASKMGVRGSIVHLGSYKDNGKNHKQLCDNIAAVLEKIPKDVEFIIENAGNRKIGQTVEEIAEIIKELKDKRLKVCLDTCHLHAAGYDLRGRTGFANFLDVFNDTIGLDRLSLWHINDSKDPFGSLRDRHENIGMGEVGVDVFKNILNHPKTKNIPCILEVPGFDGLGPDKKNMEIVKKLIN